MGVQPLADPGAPQIDVGDLLRQLLQQHQQQQQRLHLPPGPSTAAADPIKSAGMKLAAKRQADLWNSATGQKFFSLRGGFFSGIDMDAARVRMVAAEKAHITDQSADQVRELGPVWKIEHFFPPTAPGASPTALPARVHSGTMIQVLMSSIRFGMDAAPQECRGRVDAFHNELAAIYNKLQEYELLHYSQLINHPARVRDTVLDAVNDGLTIGFLDLARHADTVHLASQDCPPPAGTGGMPPIPKFARLRRLLAEDDVNSLVEKAERWAMSGPAPASAVGGKKRAAAPLSKKAAGKKKKAATPDGVCRAAWAGETCSRPQCPYEHVVPGALMGAPARMQPPMQQQQPQQL
ncbi:unnamed protein product, partial [Pylaiella littoralis]